MAAQSSPPSRRERLAKLLKHYNFAALVEARIVPVEETLYRAIDPMTLRAPDTFEGENLVSMATTCLMRRRAYALRVFLARRLSRMAAHAGFAAMWRGCARGDLYKVRLYHRAYLHARGGK